MIFAIAFTVALLAIRLGYPNQNLTFLSIAAVGLSMPISVIIYLAGYRKMNKSQIINALGLGRKVSHSSL